MHAGTRTKLAVICLCALAALLCASVQAFASRPHEFTGTFGEPCLAEPCTGGALKKPNGVAVSEATGDVYVVDEAADRVVRFDKEGAFLSELNGSGTLLNGKGEPFEGKAAGSGGEPGEVPTGKFEKPQTIAVDNSCVLRKLSEAQCEAEDPSNGDVYVGDAGHRVIDKYSAEGEYIGQISDPSPSGEFLEPTYGVAVETTGTVYLYAESYRVIKFNNAAHNALLSQIFPGGLANSPLPGIAVDSKGAAYIRHGKTAGESILFSRIAKVDVLGTVPTQELDKEESSAVAVDQTNDNALVDNLTSIAVFNPEGTLIERLGKEGGEEHLKEGAGIGVNASASTIYAAQSNGEVVVFGPKSPTTPKVESESVARVTSEEATLGAQINPRSEPGEEATSYHFEYGRCPALDPSSCQGAGYEEVPASAGQISADFEVHSVSAKVEGLAPSATYHFRAEARNSHGEGEAGEERTFTTQSSGGELTLPDNRGYELISPPDKQGANIEPISELGVIQAAASGDGITYLANAPTESQPAGYTNTVQVLSQRASASWSSRDIAIAHTSATGFAIGVGPEYKFFNPELSLSALQPFGEFIPQLSEEASESSAYLHDLSDSCGSDCFHALVTAKPGFANAIPGFGEEELCKPKVGGGSKVFCGPEFLGASEDLGHVVLSANVALEQGAAPGLYEWGAGALAPLSVLPGGEAAPVGGNKLGLESAARGAISADGARIAWSTPSSLYLRDMSRKETLQLDEAACGGGCTSGGGQFQFASADGSRVFFTDTNRLTSDSGANPGEHEADLYECKVVLNPKLSCLLSDLTPKRGEEGAGVKGSVLGASSDGEYLYFVAKGIQSGANGEGKSPASGEPNLYLRQGASTSFIATLSGGDETDWDELGGGPKSLQSQPTRVSPSGQYLEFMSQAQPTGYDNRDRATNQPTAEVYLFDAASAKLACASCDPTGERPVGVEYHKLEPGSGGLVGGPRDIWPAKALVAANVPGWTAMSLGKSRYQPRYLNNQGRLFFNTVNPLVSQDSNGTQDVYEYEPPGIKGPEGGELCTSASETYSPRSGGCVGLISSGKSSAESAFLDASESGDDVFFLTLAKLAPAIDTDNALDVYDAHVCTSALPCIVYPPPPPAPCAGESSCKAPISPQQIFGAPASSTFQGPGNLPPAPPAKPKPKTAEEVRIEKLSKALKSCRAKQNKAKRKACERSARKRYAKPKAKTKAKKAIAKAKAKRSRHASKGRGK